MTNLFEEMECLAKELNIPIMLKEGIEFIEGFIKEKDIKTVLEIGSAIGYSALKMANAGSTVTTIERDKERYNKAIDFISKSPYKDKINIILNDALNVEINEEYDLIFIDAAKGKNKEFLEKFKKNLKKNGFIIIDNIDFHGLTGKSSEINKRRLRSLVRKIEEFVEYLNNQNEFKVTKINKGDGLILLERK